MQTPVVRVDDQPDDRQAESRPARSRTGSAGAAASKSLEQRDDLGRRDDGAAVGHMQPGGAALLAAADPNPATGHVVPNRILEQVADQTVEQARIASGAG